MELPQRDPHEPDEPEGVPVASPTVIFADAPTPESEKLADAILHARPGVLFVVRA